MNKKGVCAAVAAVMVALTGCVKKDYVGQRFEPTPETQEIVYFASRKEMPADRYTLIGRYTLTGDASLDRYSIEKYAVERARAVGGDAACFVSRRIHERGAYTTNEDEHGAPLKRQPSPELTSQFGKVSPLQGEKSRMKVVVVQILIFKDRDAVRRILE